MQSLGTTIKHYQRVTSTNTVAKEWVQQGKGDGLIIYADEQTQGRGRLSREWISKQNAGLWMSVVVKPTELPKQLLMMPMALAIAVSKAIEQMIDKKAWVKWPNDIVCEGKKVCGMLAETTQFNNQMYIIAGIGINTNIKTSEFPKEIQQTATSLSEIVNNEINTTELLKCVIKMLDQEYQYLLNKDYKVIREKYKKRCITLGRDIIVKGAHEQYIAWGEDISEDGSLIVIFNGEKRTVYAGDVSVRGTNGYI